MYIQNTTQNKACVCLEEIVLRQLYIDLFIPISPTIWKPKPQHLLLDQKQTQNYVALLRRFSFKKVSENAPNTILCQVDEKHDVYDLSSPSMITSFI